METTRRVRLAAHALHHNESMTAFDPTDKEPDTEREPTVIGGSHVDPTIRSARYERRRPDGGRAFLPDAVSNHMPITAEDAEADAEEFIASATMGESVAEDARDEFVTDELGGPFVELDQDAKLPHEEDEKHHSVLPETRRARRTLVSKPSPVR